MNTWVVVGVALVIGISAAVAVSLRTPPPPPDMPITDTPVSDVPSDIAGPPKPAATPNKFQLYPGPRHTTASGLTIIEVRAGTGPAVKSGDSVAVHYQGILYADGTQFDSSYDRGEPITFTVGSGQLIKGFDEGVVGMKVGEKRQLVIPPDIAYGPAGKPPTIPANATLVFNVELMQINPSNAQ
ncbi:MAG TPA: FKBP-type peptidyl-prolyl cis-trans isomerase [Tepidisphaeraceae bacterium]|nr:FKBP-type peptidyl-prolyl cis-trans isomerase [Tepidisphaeraceae bacterium]